MDVKRNNICILFVTFDTCAPGNIYNEVFR